MTVGTAIVICVGIICVTLLGLAGIGAYTNKKSTSNKIAEELLKNINKNR